MFRTIEAEGDLCKLGPPRLYTAQDDEASKYSVRAQARQIPSAALVESDFSLLNWESGDEEPQRWLCAGQSSKGAVFQLQVEHQS